MIKSSRQPPRRIRTTVICLPLFVAVLAFSYVNENFILLCVAGLILMIWWIMAVKLIRDWVLSAASLLVLLILAELALMGLDKMRSTPHLDPSSGYLKDYFNVDSFLGYQPTPGTYTSKKYASDGSVIYDVLYDIGDDGFRITPNSVSDSILRVNLFGGSCAFGEGLNSDQTLAYALVEEQPDISVKNFGVHGYGVHQAVSLLNSDVDTTGDINLLLTFPGHAVRSACKPSYTLGTPRYRTKRKNGVLHVELDGKCETFGALPRRFVTVLSRSRVFNKSFEIIRNPNTATKDDLALYFALVQEFINISSERNQRVVIGLLPSVLPDEADRLLALDDQPNVTAIDLRLFDKVTDTGAEIYFLHEEDVHPTGLANKVRAELLVSSGAFVVDQKTETVSD